MMSTDLWGYKRIVNEDNIVLKIVYHQPYYSKWMFRDMIWISHIYGSDPYLDYIVENVNVHVVDNSCLNYCSIGARLMIGIDAINGSITYVDIPRNVKIFLDHCIVVHSELQQN